MNGHNCSYCQYRSHASYWFHGGLPSVWNALSRNTSTSSYAIRRFRRTGGTRKPNIAWCARRSRPRYLRCIRNWHNFLAKGRC